ncbi:MAG: hypothetical protein IJZ93_01160 [Clostridia bacterium]|nr:hypothetical protein [Clostridia bacterium]
MKKYIRPEIEIEKLETNDIMLISNLLKDEEGNATGVEYEEDIGIFGGTTNN